MEKTHLSVLLAQYKEYCVKEVDKLGKPVQIERPNLLAVFFGVHFSLIPFWVLKVGQLATILKPGLQMIEKTIGQQNGRGTQGMGPTHTMDLSKK